VVKWRLRKEESGEIEAEKTGGEEMEAEKRGR